jgi:hypothetical protein
VWDSWTLPIYQNLVRLPSNDSYWPLRQCLMTQPFTNLYAVNPVWSCRVYSPIVFRFTPWPTHLQLRLKLSLWGQRGVRKVRITVRIYNRYRWCLPGTAAGKMYYWPKYVLVSPGWSKRKVRIWLGLCLGRPSQKQDLLTMGSMLT